ncbi:hypothetical protein vseg_011553 [Gypsophila vaccaria]
MVIEKGESSKIKRSEKRYSVRTLNSKDTENINANVVRSYGRSRKPRLRWTDDLHHRFLKAIHTLGGVDGATPKIIQKLIGVETVTVSHVKSHLQMYRSTEVKNLIQGALETLRKRGKDTNEFIHKLSELLKSTSRSGKCQQTRLERVRTMIVEYITQLDDHPRTQPDMMGDYNGVTTINMLSEDGKTYSPYTVVNGLPAPIDSTNQGRTVKGKEKMVYPDTIEDDKMNEARKSEEYYKNVMNKMYSVVEPKMSSMLLEPVTDPNNLSLELKL